MSVLIKIVSITNFVVVSSVGVRRVDCTFKSIKSTLTLTKSMCLPTDLYRCASALLTCVTPASVSP